MHKHKITIILLILYYLWFAYVGWHMMSGTDNEGEGLRLITMVVISAVVGVLYLCVFLFKVIVAKESFKENAPFLWLILLPIIVVLCLNI